MDSESGWKPDYEAVAAYVVDWEDRGGTQEELENAYRRFGVRLHTGRTGIWGGIQQGDIIVMKIMDRIRAERAAKEPGA